MKPGEFDELIRRKFEQNDFEYNPRSWEQLSGQLGEKPKRRTMLVWWALPMSGLAASVALAMGVASMVKYQMPAAAGAAAPVAAVTAPVVPAPEQPVIIHTSASAVRHIAYSTTPRKAKAAQPAAPRNDDNANNGFGARLQAVAAAAGKAGHDKPASTPVSIARNNDQKKEHTKPVPVNDWTFADATEENIRKASGLSVTLSGGINYGLRNNGFSAGASVRKMLNKHVYVEGDVAFTSSDNVQHTTYTTWQVQPSPTATAARVAARTTGTTGNGDPAAKIMEENITVRVTKQADALYSLQYAQVTPTIGYKVSGKMSVSAGPDFQQALADKRPALLADNPEAQQVAPLFDIGLVGKSEYALARKVKAAVYYRKGINNVITPMNKFIERDYVQFQIKCTIFDK